MLDLRRIRTEPDAVAAALDRRGPGTSAVVEQVLALDNEQRRLAAERDDVRSQVKAVSKQVGRLRGQGAADEAEAKMAESRELGEREKALAADADRLTDDIRAPAARHAQPAERRRARRRRRGRQRGAAHRGLRPRRLRRAPAGAALGHRRPARPVRLRPGHQDLGLDVRHVPRLGCPPAAGARAAQPRPQRRRLRGGAPPDARAHRDDGVDRSPAEVRRRGLPRRARRPVGHPHGRGAAHVAAPRRDPRRRRPAAAVHGLHVVLPARGRVGRQGHPRPAAQPRVRQGRAAGGGGRRRAGHRLPGGRARPQRGAAPRPRAGLPHPRPVHR